MFRTSLVAFGGALGAVLRYLLMLAFQALPLGEFPVGTLLVNILGCFALGILGAWLPRTFLPVEELRLLLGVGLLGGFTTYSTFSGDFVALWQSGRPIMGLVYVVVTNVFGILALLLGRFI